MEAEKYPLSKPFPLSKTFHRSTQSLLIRFFSSKDEEVVLWSDGTLSTMHKSSFFSDNRKILKLSQVSSLKYSAGKIINKKRYKILNLLSAACGIFLIAGIPEFIENILTSNSDVLAYLPAIVALTIWSFFDKTREQNAKSERLDFELLNGKIHTIRGDLPNTSLHEVGTLGMLLGWSLGLSVFIDYVTDKVTGMADVFAVAIGIFVAFLLINKLVIYLSDGKILPGLITSSGGISQLYFAANSLSIVSPQLQISLISENNETNSVVHEIQNRLKEYDELFSSISSARDIFSAPSASLGVLTIGITCEKLMKRACKQVGIEWKINARPTLKSYIQGFCSKKEIDSKILSCLNSILDLRNRAAHDFNIDSEEFMIALNQFCSVVEWYSETIFLNRLPAS